MSTASNVLNAKFDYFLVAVCVSRQIFLHKMGQWRNKRQAHQTQLDHPIFLEINYIN